MSHVERVSGAAQRRRARKVRSWWRHEQRSIAAVVETPKHHSAGRRDTAAATFAALGPVLVHAYTQTDVALDPAVHSAPVETQI